MSPDQEHRPTIKGIALLMSLWAVSFLLSKYLYDSTNGILKLVSISLPSIFIALLIGYSIAGTTKNGLLISSTIVFAFGLALGFGIPLFDVLNR